MECPGNNVTDESPAAACRHADTHVRPVKRAGMSSFVFTRRFGCLWPMGYWPQLIVSGVGSEGIGQIRPSSRTYRIAPGAYFAASGCRVASAPMRWAK